MTNIQPYYQPRVFELRDGTKGVLRQAGLKASDPLRIAATHLQSFNDCYVAYPEDARAMREVSDRFRDKTLGGYEEFWRGEIEKSLDPGKRHAVLVFETYRHVNGLDRWVIEALANIIPVEDFVWEAMSRLVPEDKRDQSQWGDFDLIHLREGVREKGVGSIMLAATAQFMHSWGLKHMQLKAFKGNASTDWFERKGFFHMGEARIPYGGIAPVWPCYGHSDLPSLARNATKAPSLSGSPMEYLCLEQDDLAHMDLNKHLSSPSRVIPEIMARRLAEFAQGR